ncbi:MAG: LytR/AlgR family response regulator transcription factor [Lachnospira sp.]
MINIEKYTIAIVDDEKYYQEEIADTIKETLAPFGISAEISVYSNGEELKKACKHTLFDFIFMDLYLGRENGFKLVEKIDGLTSSSTKIVFITSDAVAVFDSFEYRPFDFIHKELLKMRIPKTIKRAIKMDRQNENFEFQYNDVEKSLNYNDIIYVQSDNHYINIVTQNRMYCLRGTLKDYENVFLKHDFVKIHRKYVVNLRYIIKVDDYYDQVILRNNKKLELSRTYKKAVKQMYSDYIR